MSLQNPVSKVLYFIVFYEAYALNFNRMLCLRYNGHGKMNFHSKGVSHEQKHL